MNFLDTLIMAFTNLWRRKLRAVLTALGMAIGTTSIVVMVSIGIGFQTSFEEQLSMYGSLTRIQIYPGWDSNTGQQIEFDDKLMREIEAIEHVEALMPIVNYGGQVKSGRNQAYMPLYGVDFALAETFDFLPEIGTVPDDKKVSANTLKVVMTSDMGYDMEPPRRNYSGYYNWVPYEEREPNVDLMEDRIKFSFDWSAFESGVDYEGYVPGKIYNLEVYGVVDNINVWNGFWGGFVDMDTMEQIVKDNKEHTGWQANTSIIQQVYLQADHMDNVAMILEDIRVLGLEGYGSGEWISQQQNTVNMIQNVMGVIGAVAMLVAAIGIMNTMMMSIYERTKEIGVMKVLGCKMGHIMRMFLAESGYIGFFGGILGLGISYGLSHAINTVMAESAELGGSFSSIIPPWLALGGVAFSALVAIISGLYPAYRAMRLSALAAIRNQ